MEQQRHPSIPVSYTHLDVYKRQRHNLPVINVLTDDAKIVDDYPKYAGMDRYEARKAIVEDLDKEGYLVKIEDHEHNVCLLYTSRCV